MRSVLVEKAVETMKKSGLTFRNIMPLKIFIDMYQFHQAKVATANEVSIVHNEPHPSGFIKPPTIDVTAYTDQALIDAKSAEQSPPAHQMLPTLPQGIIDYQASQAKSN